MFWGLLYFVGTKLAPTKKSLGNPQEFCAKPDYQSAGLSFTVRRKLTTASRTVVLSHTRPK